MTRFIKKLALFLRIALVYLVLLNYTFIPVAQAASGGFLVYTGSLEEEIPEEEVNLDELPPIVVATFENDPLVT
jgi:hypothetical protein